MLERPGTVHGGLFVGAGDGGGVCPDRSMLIAAANSGLSMRVPELLPPFAEQPPWV